MQLESDSYQTGVSKYLVMEYNRTIKGLNNTSDIFFAG
jgi:hypothetical protein